MVYYKDFQGSSLYNFTKLLIYNILLAACLMLMVLALLICILDIKLYKVETGSMSPVYNINDLVMVKEKQDYKIGDILKFNHNGTPTLHRLIGIKTKMIGESEDTIYICHGDVSGSVNPLQKHEIRSWQEEVEYIENLSYSQIICEGNQVVVNCQIVNLNQIEGSAVAGLSRWGGYIEFVNNHKYLLISAVIAIWVGLTLLSI